MADINTTSFIVAVVLTNFLTGASAWLLGWNIGAHHVLTKWRKAVPDAL